MYKICENSLKSKNLQTCSVIFGICRKIDLGIFAITTNPKVMV